MSLFTQRIFCVYNSGNCISTPPPYVLSPVNETITHKSQNELMFSINRASWVMSCHQDPSRLFGFVNHFLSENWKVTRTFWSELTAKIYVTVYCVLINVIRDKALFYREWQMLNKFRRVTSVYVLRFILQLSVINWTVCSLLILDKFVLHLNSAVRLGL